ncbi:MAG: hypothetical protein J6Y44_01715 [Clostridia bacterium]|nr:hypothetical protein [Clostridia bacterium]
MKSDLQSKIKKALTKKAVGYQTKEIVEEYQDDEGILKLTKKRVTKKHIPPDTQAARIVLETMEEAPIENMTDEELEAEKQKLIKILKEENDEEGEN